MAVVGVSWHGGLAARWYAGGFLLTHERLSPALLDGLVGCGRQPFFLPGALSRWGSSGQAGAQEGGLLCGSACQCFRSMHTAEPNVAGCPAALPSPGRLGDRVRSRAATEVKRTQGDMSRRHGSQSTSRPSVQEGAFGKAVIDAGEYLPGAGALQPRGDDMGRTFPFARARVACEEASFSLYVRRVLTGRKRKTEKKQLLCARHHARGIYKFYFVKSSKQLRGRCCHPHFVD